MNIVRTSLTGKLILRYVKVPDASEYLPAYHTHWRSQVQKMLDFGHLKINMLIYKKYIISAAGENFGLWSR